MDDDLVISAAEKVADIEDVLMNILVRLPPLSLGRITCVSKRWNAMVTSPFFARKYRSFPIYKRNNGFHFKDYIRYRICSDKLFPPKTPSRYDINRPSYKNVVFIKKKSQA